MSDVKNSMKKFLSKIGIGFCISEKQSQLFWDGYIDIIDNPEKIYSLNKKLGRSVDSKRNEFSNSNIFNRRKISNNLKCELIKHYGLKLYLPMLLYVESKDLKKEDYFFFESYYNYIENKNTVEDDSRIEAYVNKKFVDNINNHEPCDIKNEMNKLENIIDETRCFYCNHNMFHQKNFSFKNYEECVCEKCGKSLRVFDEQDVTYEDLGYEIQGLDLYFYIKVTDTNQTREVEIPTIDGPIVLKVPANINDGSTLRLKNKGLTKNGECGHLYVIVDIEDNDIINRGYSGSSTSKYNNKSSNQELEDLIGLSTVKEQIKRMKAILIKNKGRNSNVNLHMCFYGNPGTGKTVVARLIANIFYELGVLPTNNLIETDRSGLCAEYIGQTGPKTHAKVQEAMGGVLFIDEAYTLSNSNESGNDFGKEAIAALLKDMEDYKGKFCVILAGYKKEMDDMISTNPGFDSRINRKIDFPDYSIDEMFEIMKLMLKKEDYIMSKDANEDIKRVFEYESKTKNFANARTVRNIVDNLIEIQAVRTIEDSDSKNDDERIIKLVDVQKYIKEMY